MDRSRSARVVAARFCSGNVEVIGAVGSGWVGLDLWVFGFGLGGFWLDCLVFWFRTHSREGRWLLDFTTVFSACLGILVGAVALAAASAAAAALAAAQIS